MNYSPSIETLDRLYNTGTISRATYQKWRAVWLWAAPHYGGDYGRVHDRYYEKYGRCRYWQRIRKVRTFMATLPPIA